VKVPSPSNLIARGALSCDASSAQTPSELLRQNLDQIGKLRLGEFRGSEFQSDRVLDDRFEADGFIRLD
jgi:hypothetical protein